MNTHMYIKMNEARCINCKACEIACQTFHELPMPLCRHEGEFVFENGKTEIALRHYGCLHCVHPTCLHACPTGAMYLTEDNTVLIKQDLCDGCGKCIEACPTHIPQLHPVTGKAYKCDLCYDRRVQGLEPACVSACLTHALSLENDEAAHKKHFVQQIKNFKHDHKPKA